MLLCRLTSYHARGHAPVLDQSTTETNRLQGDVQSSTFQMQQQAHFRLQAAMTDWPVLYVKPHSARTGTDFATFGCSRAS